MTRLVRFGAAIALAAPLVLAAGCQQGQGERCQVQSDCGDGLICVLPAGGTPQAGGTCQPPSSGVVADMSVGDMAGTTPPNDLATGNTSD
jgi:hypothetical protein